MADHAVIIRLKLSDGEHGTPEERESMHALQEKLTAAIDDQSAGELDGDEFGGGECTIYTYGPDADKLFSAMESILKESPLSIGGTLTKRYGDARDDNTREEKIKL